MLADFDAGATEILGMAPAAYERRFGLRKFWQALAAAPDFFGGLKLMPDALELFEAVRHRTPVILTGLPRGAWAEGQKRRWAAPGVEVITTSAALKSEYCHPGDALVDDREKFRHLWEREGGVFIHHRARRARSQASERLDFSRAGATSSSPAQFCLRPHS